jgi:hypothetical protein
MNNDSKEQFIIEYFKQVREELTVRVQIHTNLVLQKIATCGAALGFLFSQKLVASETQLVPIKIQLLAFAVIPIIAMGYDVMIARNINNLHRLGTFIREELEPLVTEVKLWEKHYGQNPNKPKNHGNTEIIFLSLFTLSTEVIAGVIYLNLNKIYLIFVLFLLLAHSFVFIFMRQQILIFDK